MKPPKSCKLCAGKRYGNLSWCWKHFREREKAKKTERLERKAHRRSLSKTFQESQRRPLRNKLDKAFSLVIRASGKCARCGKREPQVRLECSHIYSRANLAVRWDALNAKCLCSGCHFWWHQNPVDAAEWLKTIRSPEQLEGLRLRANSVKKWSVPELKELLDRLNEELLK